MELTTDKVLYGKRGQRKQRVNFITMIFLLGGFAIAAWMKVEFNLYLAYCLGLTGANWGFIYGNSVEHKADATIATATGIPPSI